VDNPEEIRKIADTRLIEAKLLLDSEHYSGAFYLAGYSVELYLKSKICELFGVADLFAEKTQKTIEGVGHVRESVKIHNLFTLLIFSGLRSEYDLLKKDKNKLKDNEDKNKLKIFRIGSFMMSNWNETERYKTATSIKEKQINKIKNTINNLDIFLQWINTN
jgi:hypothetical protein